MWILFFILVGVWLIYTKINEKTEQTSKVNSDDEELEEEIDDETVFKVQKAFEEKILETYLPDRISGKEIYIYRNLMAGWYKNNSALYRYEDEKVKKIRKDWIDYLEAVKNQNTYSFLSVEIENEADKKLNSENCLIASQKTVMIEDSFAALIGKEAVDQLTKVRALSFSKFDEHGNLL